jgi:hypothetical protein
MDLQSPVWGEDDEPDVEDAFGEHDIEYWVWSGKKLVPASPEQAALLREHEALLRLAQWRSLQEGARPTSQRPWWPRVVTRLARMPRFRPAMALPSGRGRHSARLTGATVPAAEQNPTGGQTQSQRPTPKS